MLTVFVESPGHQPKLASGGCLNWAAGLFEMDEAKMSVIVSADEKQVLAKEAGEVGRLLSLWH